MADPIPPQERRRRKRMVEYALRLGEDERAAIARRAAASGVSMAHFVRSAALAETERGAVLSGHEANALIRELARIGLTLNAVMRSVISAQPTRAADLEAVLVELGAALKLVAELRER